VGEKNPQDDIYDLTSESKSGGVPPGSQAAKRSSRPPWTDRLKRRWKSMLEWLARGAEHACPT
jgi:hypothetical protein